MDTVTVTSHKTGQLLRWVNQVGFAYLQARPKRQLILLHYYLM